MSEDYSTFKIPYYDNIAKNPVLATQPVEKFELFAELNAISEEIELCRSRIC